MNKHVQWSNLEKPGSESLKIKNVDSSLVAEGVVLLATDGDVRKFSYQVVTDEEWTTKTVEVTNHEQHAQLFLYCKEGKWYRRDKELREMSGAVDVDLSITPFSNSLHINRFTWENGQERKLDVLYIDASNFELLNLAQHYTYEGNADDGNRLFQYRCRDYRTIITVDEDGFVVDYPGVFLRR
ncbi:putative glycolipid-binding domain-containing protein [Halobacillus litoralis]|uniref:putative glycolipid-binding domain-containing protein n=1 Tax=Halobacillus litoralis TaxID=45668 RepID=UPI001CD5B8DC|nr:putative glycolipid-binding domain-containing protein [Halobacillus litoralis]MCA0970877.1 putative glycolipid-binding domain-containing protein [Halobacillus litoralis]